MKISRTNIRGFSAALVFFITILVGLVAIPVNAADLANRTVSLSSSFVGEVSTHSYAFGTEGASTIGSISFEYCTNSPLFSQPCTQPVGLDVSGFVIGSQAGIIGFTKSASTTANNAIITRVPSVEAASNASYTFDSITNPTTADEIIYVRISVYDGIDGTGTRVDEGAVVFVTEDRFDVTAYVPPYLTFCVAVTVSLDCTTTAGFLADFGEFSPTLATAVTTQFAAATNDGTGYNTFIGGQTMTSGTNIIPALPVQAASSPGASQFGINLRANTAPSVGAEPEAGFVASGAPDPSYNVPNQYRFVNGERIAGSAITTGFNRYTVSYIVNVNPAQAAGIYATTFTYTAIASF